MKKYIIILAAVILVLTLAVVLLLLIGGRGRERADDPDCRFAYTYTTKGSDILLTVKGKPDSGYAWTAVADISDSVTVTQESAGKRKSVFRISPAAAGTDAVKLALTKPGELPDCLYLITTVLYVNEDGELTVIGYSHAECGGLHHVTPETGSSYTYTSDDNGRLHLYIHDTVNEAWDVTADRKGIVSVELTDDDEAHFVISAAMPGTCTVYAHSNDSKTAVCLQVTAAESGVALVTDSSTVPYDKKDMEREKALADIENTYGKVVLPDGSKLENAGQFMLTDEMGMRRTPVRVSYEKDGITWQYVMLNLTRRSTLEAYFGEDASSITTTSVNGYDAVVIRTETEYRDTDEDGELQEDGELIRTVTVTVIWTNDNLCCCALQGENISVDEAVAAAQQICTLNPDAGVPERHDGAQ